jgi:hypothetical protein
VARSAGGERRNWAVEWGRFVAVTAGRGYGEGEESSGGGGGGGGAPAAELVAAASFSSMPYGEERLLGV